MLISDKYNVTIPGRTADVIKAKADALEGAPILERLVSLVGLVAIATAVSRRRRQLCV